MSNNLKYELWTVGDIATYLKYAPRSTREMIRKDNSFPRPHVMPLGGKRWFAEEVVAWFRARPKINQAV